VSCGIRGRSVAVQADESQIRVFGPKTAAKRSQVYLRLAKRCLGERIPCTATAITEDATRVYYHMRESGTRPTTDHSAMIAWVESRSLGGKSNAGRFGDAGNTASLWYERIRSTNIDCSTHLISRLTGGWGCNAMIIREVDGEIDHLKELTPVAKRNTGQHRLSRVPGPIIPLIEVTDDLQEGYEVAVERFGSTLRSGLEARVQI
jgi:hypothetical protein